MFKFLYNLGNLLNRLHKGDNDQQVVIMMQDNIDHVVDYMVKPAPLEDVIAKIEKALRYKNVDIQGNY